ncbi:hypothetical protein GQ457_09G013510 [Hibiscus cannabinus]
MDPEKNEIANVPMENKSFALKWDSAAEGAHATHSSDTWLWHRRYGHFNMYALCELHKKNMVRDFPSISLSNDLYICGPHRTLSLGGNKYFIIFIDDFTRMTWVYFMKEKSEVFKVFKKFKALAEVQSGCKLQKLRSDRGKEYTSTKFDLSCENKGIEHQLTVGYTPQQNGVSERKNRTVMDMARCILMEKNLPKKLWAEAKRSKLDAKDERGIFLGYDSQAKGYRIFNLDTEKIMISRDVEFNEDASWNWDEEKVEKKNYVMVSNLNDAVNDEPSNEMMRVEKLTMTIRLHLSLLYNPMVIVHMKIKFYALQEAQQHKEVKLVHCPSEYQLADILTKALPKGRFEFLRFKLGMMAKSLKEEC